MNVAELQRTLGEKAFNMGASLFKIADLTTAADYIVLQYGEFFAQFPRAISIAVYFPREIVQQQLEGPTRSYAYFYHSINRQLDAISLTLANVIQTCGYRAYPIPASDYRESKRAERLQYLVNEENPESMPPATVELCGIFGHRLAANLAGVGWVGKSCSIINPDVGPRLRLTTILTNAQFTPDEAIASKCGGCTNCRDACPAKALSGTALQPGQSIEERFDRKKCKSHLAKIESVFGQGTCALCLAVCPWGQAKTKIDPH